MQEGRIEKTDTQTDTQDNYCNSRCACAPRVKNYLTFVLSTLQYEHHALLHVLPSFILSDTKGNIW